MKRVAIAAIAGAAAGLTVSTLIGIPFLRGPAGLASLLENAFTFWGIFFGSFTAAGTFGLALMVLNRRTRGLARFGRALVILTLGVLGVLTWWWIAMWGFFSPFTLEGMWIYPLAMIPSALAIWMILAPRRMRKLRASGRIDWTQPPSS